MRRSLPDDETNVDSKKQNNNQVKYQLDTKISTTHLICFLICIPYLALYISVLCYL